LDFAGGLYYFEEHDFTYNGLYGPALPLITASINDQTNLSAAIYAQGSYALTERLSLTAGLRYTAEDKDFLRLQRIFLGPAPDYPVPWLGPGGVEITRIDTSEDWTALTPRVGVDYHVTPDLMLYASASRGFKSGGFDGRANTAEAAAPYDPETLWAYEAGVRSQSRDDRVTANFTVFYNDYTDLQLSSFVADENGGFAALFTNAGRATTYGAELDLVLRPLEDLTLTANIGYLDGGYDEYVGPNGADISDQRELVNAPRWTARLAAQQEISLGSMGSLVVGADAAHRSKTYPTVSSSEVLAQDEYTIIDAYLRYLSPDESWRLTLGGQNLTDEHYITQGFDLSDSLGYQLAYYGDPRTFTLTLGLRF
jgi:iron complex outermembrane receptor protein